MHVCYASRMMTPKQVHILLLLYHKSRNVHALDIWYFGHTRLVANQSRRHSENTASFFRPHLVPKFF